MLETLLFSIFLGLAGGLVIGGITSLVLLIMGDLSLGGVGVAIVNSFLAAASVGILAGIIVRLLALPIAAIFELVLQNSEAAVKVSSILLTIPLVILLFGGVVWTPILTVEHNELFIWHWLQQELMQWREVIEH